MLPPEIRVVEMTTDDAWARDTGPTFVVDSAKNERRGVDWVFNAWGGLDGGLFFPWANDDLVAAKVCELDGRLVTAPRSCSRAARSRWTAKVRA